MVEAVAVHPEVQERISATFKFNPNYVERESGIAGWNNALRDNHDATEIVASMFDRVAEQAERSEDAIPASVRKIFEEKIAA